MANFTAEKGNFEGRPRASKGFGGLAGQNAQQGHGGEAKGGRFMGSAGPFVGGSLAQGQVMQRPGVLPWRGQLSTPQAPVAGLTALRGPFTGVPPSYPPSGTGHVNPRAALAALLQQQLQSRVAPIISPGEPQRYVPLPISDQVPGLPVYGTAGQGAGKAAGYGGVPRYAAIGSPDAYF